MGRDTPRVETMVQRAAQVPGGYALAVHVATTVPVQAWQARVTLDADADAEPGPGTNWDGTIATGSPQTIRPGHHATAWLGVTGTVNAPRHIQVAALDADGTEIIAPVVQVMVTDPATGQARQATDQDWQGAQNLTGQAGGSGSGGGGGGGGQYTCDLYVDMERRIVSHRIVSDAGGGGGSGAGASTNHQQHGQYYGAAA